MKKRSRAHEAGSIEERDMWSTTCATRTGPAFGLSRTHERPHEASAKLSRRPKPPDESDDSPNDAARKCHFLLALFFLRPLLFFGHGAVSFFLSHVLRNLRQICPKLGRNKNVRSVSETWTKLARNLSFTQVSYPN